MGQAGPPLPGVLKMSAGKSRLAPRPRLSSRTRAAVLGSPDPRVPRLPTSCCTHRDVQSGFWPRAEDAAYHGSSSSSGSAGWTVPVDRQMDGHLSEVVVDVAVVSLEGAVCVGFQLLLPTGLKAHRAGKAELSVFEKSKSNPMRVLQEKKNS